MNETARSERTVPTAPPGLVRRLGGVRERVRALPGGAVAWRIGISVFGLAVVVVGVLLLPLPGPGWLIIFAGLGMLATEYDWAARLLRRARWLVAGWTQWAARQEVWVRIVFGLLATLILAVAVLGSWYLYTIV
jgi:uncharacterized protein (TIGR02611 family)